MKSSRTIELWPWLFYSTLLVVIWWVIQTIMRSLKLSNIHRRHVLITGCDSGFGFLLALRLDAMGLSVFAGCLTEKGMERIQQETSYRVSPIHLDITSSESITNAVNIVSDRTKRDKTGLWALVNNAGISGPVGPLEWLRIKDYTKTLSVNLFGMIEMTRQFLPFLRLGKGRLINMSSSNGSVTVPYFSPYTISKYGVEVFSDSLRPEARKYGVSVHLIKPGMFDTNIRSVPPILDDLIKSHNGLSPSVKQVYPNEFLDKFIPPNAKRSSALR